MSWYDPTSWDWGKLNPFNWDFSTDADRMNANRGQLLNQQGAAAAQFGQQTGYNYGADQIPLQQSINYLQGVAQGNNSVSAEQLRQGLQQQYAQQRSMAASANPGNSAMAAFNAARNMGTAGTALAGQQAIAGLQERQNAQQALGQLALGMRGQDLQGFLGANRNAMAAYGAQAPQSMADQMLGGLAGGAGAYLTKMAMSDKNLKTNVDEGDKAASKAMSKLAPKTFDYKDEQHGKGKQLGIMAQDLQKAGLGHTVVETPMGKAVHGGKAATTALAMVATLHKRLSHLEKKVG